MEVFTSSSEATHKSTCSSVVEASSDSLFATHTHRDFSMDGLLSKLASTNRANENLPSRKGSYGNHHTAHFQEAEGSRKRSTRSNNTDDYDPELEMLVKERLQDLQVRDLSLQAHEPQALPSNERECPVAPAIPPREPKGGITPGGSNGRTVNPATVVTSKSRLPLAATLVADTTKTRACGSSLEPSANGVCQQRGGGGDASGMVINGDRDYINQDHLDAILEDQEGDATELESSILYKRKHEESVAGDEGTVTAVLSNPKTRRGRLCYFFLLMHS